MSLDEAVDLVLFAFKNANPGDIFVQKAPACRIEDLALSISKIMNVDINFKTIGVRHGEKMYEVLLSSEESSKAEDMGDFYRVPADNRSLNYDNYNVMGDIMRSQYKEFNSKNTKQLSVDEITKKLVNLNDFQELI